MARDEAGPVTVMNEAGPGRAARAGAEPADSEGVICAFLFDETGAARTVGRSESGSGDGTAGRFVWLHLNGSDNRAKRWLHDAAGIPADAVELLLGTAEARSSLVPSGAGLAGLLWDLRFDREDDAPEPATIRLYVDARRLITVRTHPLAGVDRLRRAVQGGARFGGTGFLVAALLGELADGFAAAATALSEEIDGIEDEMLAGAGVAMRGRLAAIRRATATLRRRAAPERHVLLRGVDRRTSPWPDPAESEALHRAIDELGAVVDAIETAQDRAKLLLEELAARATEETNRNLVVLSVLTAILLPATLITGIFGMNVAGLPGLQDHAAFWWVIGVMVAVAAATVGLLRWLRLF